MNTKARAAVDGIKDLGQEVSAWEGRLLYLQNEAKNLERKNEQVKKDIEAAIALGQQELDKRGNQARSEMALVKEEREKLMKDKEEFAVMLTDFKKERNEFAREKTRILDQAETDKKIMSKVSNFILLVKRESQGL